MAKKYHNGAMISQNKTSPGNVPEQWINKEYPSNEFISCDYEDTIVGIDRNIDKTVQNAKRQELKGKKY